MYSESYHDISLSSILAHGLEATVRHPLASSTLVTENFIKSLLLIYLQENPHMEPNSLISPGKNLSPVHEHKFDESQKLRSRRYALLARCGLRL